LTAEPGTYWEYSDTGFAHLSLFFYHATGRELFDFMKERVSTPSAFRMLVGIGKVESEGISGLITNPHSGLRFSARDLRAWDI